MTGFASTGIEPIIGLPQEDLDDAKYKELEEMTQKINESKVIAEKRRKNAFYDYKDSSWFDILKVSQKQVPRNKFLGIYMQSQAPTQILHTGISDKVSMKYSLRKKFYNIDPDHFMALWVGDFTFKKTSRKELTLSVSWAKVKLKIDGKVVYEGGNSQKIPFTFTKGMHRIEIEYQNNYGQVDFLFDMQDIVPEVGENLKSLVSKDTKIYMVGTYDGGRADHGLDVLMKNSRKPVVLFVASYAATHWNIINAKNIKAVVFNSYAPGSSVRTDNPNTKVFHDQGLRYAERLLPFCYNGPIRHCENKYAFITSIDHIAKLTGKKPDGFSSLHVPELSTTRLKLSDNRDPILVPQIRLDDAMYDKIDLGMKNITGGQANKY